MKYLLVLTFLLLVSLSMNAQKKNKNAHVSINVDGVCEMCKKRIEKAALKTKGVKYARWNVDTHELKLIINERKTDLLNVCQNIANAGHDNELIKATDEVYATLHSCCLYRNSDDKRPKVH